MTRVLNFIIVKFGCTHCPPPPPEMVMRAHGSFTSAIILMRSKEYSVLCLSVPGSSAMCDLPIILVSSSMIKTVQVNLCPT